MLVTVLCLTYMMIIILIHAIWISSVIKHDGKCHYGNSYHKDPNMPDESDVHNSDDFDGMFRFRKIISE